jgi:hypothetical protein
MAYRSNERSMPVESGTSDRSRGSSSDSSRSSDSSMEDRMRGEGEENIRGVGSDDDELEETEVLEEEDEDEGSF